MHKLRILFFIKNIDYIDKNIMKFNNRLLIGNKYFVKIKLIIIIISEVIFMKRETLFLKIIVFLIGIPILGLCIFVLPRFPVFYAEWLPELAYLRYPLVIFFYMTAIAYFFALYQALKLLSYIDQNKAFSDLSLIALKKIKYSALTISILYSISMPMFYLTADKDDAPGLIIIGLVIICASIVVAIFAAVLQKLLKNAIDIKSENDLTI